MTCPRPCPRLSLLLLLALGLFVSTTSAQDNNPAPPLAEFEIPANDANANNEDNGDKSLKKNHHPHPTPAPRPALNLTRPPTGQLIYRADRLSSCSWSPVLSPEKDKPFLPDLNIQYNMQGFTFGSNALKRRQQQQQKQEQHHKHHHHDHKHLKKTQPPTPAPTPLPWDQEEVYRIRGHYPYVRYFSYSVYDMSLQTVSTLHDTQIRPSWGKNPFSDRTTTEEDMGSYEIYITKDGRHGYPNEMAALRPNSTSVYAFLSFRLQELDPRKGRDRSGKNRDWGYVEMPVVEILNHKNGKWEVIRRCSEEFQAREEDFIEHLDVSFNRWWPQQVNIGAECNATQFSLFDPDRNPIIRRAVAVRNDNENYIFWCMPDEIATKRQYVVRITGTLPQTPYGLFNEIRVPETERYDARYVSFTSADATPLYPSYQTLGDTEIRQHYTNSPTGEGWNRRYSIISTSDVTLAKACGLYHEDQDLLLSLTHPPMYKRLPHHPAIVMRELLPRDGQERVGTEGVANVALRNECVGSDGKLICDQATAARSLLKEFYPKVEVFSCHMHDHKPVQLF